MEPLYALVVCISSAGAPLPPMVPSEPVPFLTASECLAQQDLMDMLRYERVRAVTFCQKQEKDGSVAPPACLGPHPEGTIVGKVRRYR